jgi:hypothetical protein
MSLRAWQIVALCCYASGSLMFLAGTVVSLIALCASERETGEMDTLTIADLKAIREEQRTHLRASEYAPPKVQQRLQLSIAAMDALIREREAELISQN